MGLGKRRHVKAHSVPCHHSERQDALVTEERVTHSLQQCVGRSSVMCVVGGKAREGGKGV